MDSMGILSLLPPVIALVMAMLTRNVVISLFSAVLAGVGLLAGGSPVHMLQMLFGDFMFAQLGDSYNAGIIILLLFIGGFVALIEKSGGASAFAKGTSRLLNTKAKTQIAAWLGGVGIFFSDSGTPLIVGPIFEKLADKVKMSREKLAWIIDSTSSPMAILVPFISWGVYIIGLIGKEFKTLGINESDFMAFMKAIPFQFYALSSLLMIPLVAVAKLDFGPMRKAEERIEQTGRLFWPHSKPVRPVETAGKECEAKAKSYFVWAPILVLLMTMVGFLLPQGFPFRQIDGQSFLIALTAGYLVASIVLFSFIIFHKVKKFAETFEIYFSGMQQIGNVGIILVLAWSLGAVIKKLGAANYIVELMSGSVPGYIIPMLIFLVGAIMSFATGSSWGTFAIMMPLAIPLSVHLDAPLYVSIAAVLSGGLFGDHCSPLSDTTILAATGAGCDLIDHVKTQIPYALVNAAGSIMAYLAAGYTGSVYTLLIALGFMISTVLLLSKLQGRRLGFVARDQAGQP